MFRKPEIGDWAKEGPTIISLSFIFFANKNNKRTEKDKKNAVN